MKNVVWRLAVSLAGAALLAGCAPGSAVPEGYTGPLARIADTGFSSGPTSAVIFALTAVNGQSIDDSMAATGRANTGRGMAVAPAIIDRAVPAESATFTIVGRRIYGAPIMGLMRPSYEVTGDVKFTPVADRTYKVRGQIRRDYSAVWIEDQETGAIMGSKVELKKGVASNAAVDAQPGATK